MLEQTVAGTGNSAGQQHGEDTGTEVAAGKVLSVLDA
jgi:hypothetical protein